MRLLEGTNTEEWSVRTLLDRYDTLGLPHFQRGHVWNTDTVSLLLESLYFDTPCGTLILWKPQRPQEQGIALPGCDIKRVTYLIIDGQQRIRSIHDALADLSTESTEEGDAAASDEEGAHEPVWCLNLVRLPVLSGLLDEHALRERPLFMRATDPRERSAKRYKYNLLPLSYLADAAEKQLPIDWDWIAPADGGTTGDVLAALRQHDIASRAQAIFVRKLVVIFKEEAGEKNDLADMVQLYNRINSGGMRIQAEEKAFATLVATYPETSQRLGRLFQEVHGPSDVSRDKALARDETLRRTRENRFGFKLFMRAFVQTASHHTGYSIGSSGLSFDVVNSGRITRYLVEGDQRVDKLFDQWERLVKDVACLLRNDLYCDGFQFLPDTASLVPVFQLLLKYPDLLKIPSHRRLGALLLLKLMLAELRQRDLFEIARAVRDTNTLAECSPIIGSVELTRLSEDRLLYSNSLADRYVLLLYWLVHKMGARDFSYRQIASETRRRLPEQEVTIDHLCSPEKQHIVPYARLKETYQITDRGRLSSHKVNNIGNLTYISADLNHFDTGLGEQPLDLELEKRENPSNLEAHLLADSEWDGDLRGAFTGAMASFEKEDDIARQRETFEEFCKLRRELIIRRFRQWLHEIETAEVAQEPIDQRTEPVAPLFHQTIQDLVRSLEYHNLVEDQLIAMHRLGGLIKIRARREANGHHRFDVVHKDGRRQRTILTLTSRSDHIRLRLSDSSPIARAIGSAVESRRGYPLQSAGVIAVLGDGTYRLDCTAAGARTTAALLRDTIAILERVAAGSDDDGDQ